MSADNLLQSVTACIDEDRCSVFAWLVSVLAKVSISDEGSGIMVRVGRNGYDEFGIRSGLTELNITLEVGGKHCFGDVQSDAHALFFVAIKWPKEQAMLFSSNTFSIVSDADVDFLISD